MVRAWENSGWSCIDMWLKGIGHVRYIDTLTWLRGFQDKLLAMLEYWYIECGLFNSLLPSCLKPFYQSEAWRKNYS